MHDLATGRHLHEKAPVQIVGPCGTGKSHLAQALGHCAVRRGIDVVFTTFAGLTQSINATRATGGYARKLATLARVPLLIINDFGLKPLRAPADEDLPDCRALRAGLHHRHQQFGLPRMGSGLPRQSTTGQHKPRQTSPQRLLPSAGRSYLSLSLAAARRVHQIQPSKGCKINPALTPSGRRFTHLLLAPLRRTSVAPLRRSVKLSDQTLAPGG